MLFNNVGDDAQLAFSLVKRKWFGLIISVRVIENWKKPTQVINLLLLLQTPRM